MAPSAAMGTLRQRRRPQVFRHRSVLAVQEHAASSRAGLGHINDRDQPRHDRNRKRDQQRRARHRPHQGNRGHNERAKCGAIYGRRLRVRQPSDHVPQFQKQSRNHQSWWPRGVSRVANLANCWNTLRAEWPQRSRERQARRSKIIRIGQSAAKPPDRRKVQRPS